MFSFFERWVAFRYLRSKKQEGTVSVIAFFSFMGILLGVATLIIVLSVMNGFRDELFSRLIGLNGHVTMYARGGSVTEYENIADKAREMQGVSDAFPVIQKESLLKTGSVTSGIIVRGITSDDFSRKPVLSGSVKLGSLTAFQPGTVAVGIKMAERLALDVGDSITILAPSGKATPFGTIPRSRQYTVKIIFDVGMFEYNNNFVYMPLSDAQLLYQLREAVSQIQIFTPDADKANDVKRALKFMFEDRFSVLDWRDINGSFANALEVERNVMFIILTLIILVAAFNIISSMIMLVKDKTRDIAIMRTMGASRSSMLKIFLLTGASIGFIGTFFGAVLGISFASNIEKIRRWLESLTNTELFADEIYFLSRLPAKIDPLEVALVIAIAFVLSFLATLYPAWRAARLNLVEALRYD